MSIDIDPPTPYPMIMADDSPPSDEAPPMLPWQRSTPELLLETRIFSVHGVESQSVTRPEKSGSFVYLHAGDWVQVVATTDEDELVLVEQYRHGLDTVTLEIPGGMVDPGEDVLSAGLRELREETGYAGEGGSLIGKSSPNPAILDNWCHTVRVAGVRKVGAPELDGSEETRVRLVPRAEVGRLVATGAIHHALVLAGLLLDRLNPDGG